MIAHHLSRAGGVVIFSFVSVTAAYSQSNELRIDQTGAGNSLVVDQSAASRSRVGGAGLTTGPGESLPSSLLIEGEDSVASPAAISEREALLFGNAEAPALQLGNDNQARIAVRGADNRVVLEQDSRNGLGSDGGNKAKVAINSTASAGSASFSPEEASAIASDFVGSSAYVIQQGRGNSADVSITGKLSTAGAVQIGDGNQANVGVSGDGVSGTVFQKGNFNAVDLSVTGTPGSGVIYNQIGNGNYNQVAQPSVVTNGATVVITQTNFGQ